MVCLVHSRNSSEHALEDGEQKIRDLITPHRWRSKHTFHAEVIQIANVFSRGVGECQRVAPKEPLK